MEHHDDRHWRSTFCLQFIWSYQTGNILVTDWLVSDLSQKLMIFTFHDLVVGHENGATQGDTEQLRAGVLLCRNGGNHQTIRMLHALYDAGLIHNTNVQNCQICFSLFPGCIYFWLFGAEMVESFDLFFNWSVLQHWQISGMMWSKDDSKDL